MKTPIVAIIGRENTGKSTLFNSLTNTRQAITSSIPGFTRDRRYGSFAINNMNYRLVDTGGITDANSYFYSDAVNAQAFAGIEEATLVYFVISSEHDAAVDEIDLLSHLRKKGVQIIVVASKSDKVRASALQQRNFFYLGYEVVPVDSLKRKGLDKLLELTLEKVQGTPLEDGEGELSEEAESTIVCSIVGRPNVGKSTLINKIVGENRMVTCDQPGTTTDSIEIPFTRGNRKWLLIDTAGIRRRVKVSSDIETLSVVRVLNLLYDTGIVIAVLDGTEGTLSRQDLFLLRHCFTVRRKTLLIAVNKSEMMDGKQKLALEKEIKFKFPKLQYGAISYISAATGRNVTNLLDQVQAEYDASRGIGISSHALTAYLNKNVSRCNNMKFKINYAHVGGHDPLAIVVHGQRMHNVKSSDKAFIESTVRKFFKLSSTPVKIIIKQKERD